MLQTINLFVFALYFVGHIEKCHSHYVDRYTNNRMRILMYAMDRELIKDAQQKVRSCHYMKSLYSKSPSYHIAERIFYIRRKFARMMRLYVAAHERLKKDPHGWHLEFYQTTMVDIQKLGMDVDHLVEMLTEWEEGTPKKMVNLAGILLPADLLKFNEDGIAIATMQGMGSMPTPPGMPAAGSRGAHGPGGAPGPSRRSGLKEGSERDRARLIEGLEPRAGPEPDRARLRESLEPERGPEPDGARSIGARQTAGAWIPNDLAAARIARPRADTFGWF